MADGDETLVERVARKVRRSNYEGDERRAAPPAEWHKYAPIVLAVLAGIMGYARLQAKVELLDERRIEMKADIAEMRGDLKVLRSMIER